MKANILASGRILQTRETERLSFTAPTQPGVYPYVLHVSGALAADVWRAVRGRRFGCLASVTRRRYLAAVKLPIKDDLLKDRRPRTEWKFEDLSELVAKTTEGRSYAHGKQLFKVASCVACHKLDGEGNEFGADLLTARSETDDRGHPQGYRGAVVPDQRQVSVVHFSA